MDRVLDFLSKPVAAGSEVWRIVLFFGILLLALIIGKLFQAGFRKAGKKQQVREHPYGAVVLNALGRAMPLVLFVIGLQQAVRVLVLPESIAGMTDSVLYVLRVIAVAGVLYFLVDIVDAWLGRFAESTRSKLDDMLVPLVRKSLRVSIVVLALIQIADALSDEPVTTLLTGLGVGGLAVALAAQDALKNFFGSIVILSDKPFEIGDRIVVDGFDGPVVEVGFRSTRIRTLDGHLVTVPNGELANKTVQNIGQRPYIKRVANITVTYDTPEDKLQRAIDIIKEELDQHEGMNPEFPPRVYFSDFNDCSLNILVIYWYHPPNYWDFMAFNEQFNMKIFKRFNEEGIDFAFPTQTTFLAGDPSRPLTVHTAQS